MHILLHFIAPALVVFLFYREQFRREYLIMMATMLVDVDHLLASPIYDPLRCSIAFHPMHSFIAVAGYVALCFFKKTRVVGLGLVVHMFLDTVDCQYTSGVWYHGG